MYLDFNLYSEDELEKHSVLITKKNELVDNTTSYTLVLPCKQCKKIIECPGHLGRIPLHCRIVHPLFVDTLCKEITHICPVCKKYRKNNIKKSKCCKKVIVPASFALRKPKENEENANKRKRKYEKKEYSGYMFSFGNTFLSIDAMYDLVSSADFSEDPEIRQKLLNVFMFSIPVMPINMRPTINNSSSIIIHNNITSIYFRFLDLNYQYRRNRMYETPSLYTLKAINLFRKLLGMRSMTDTSDDGDKSFIKQMISGKSGIFRGMCLAKRQNFCLRSVVVPNINTPLDVILIPKEFTDQLIPYGYKPNDYIIINRQPTLQSTSLLAVRTIPSNSRTIQINPLIASVFQADFDGDEMNLFWLPGEEAKKELETKLNIAKHIRSFKNGSLLIKFIQDTLTGLYNMTRDNTKADPFLIKRICKTLNISKKKWIQFSMYYKSVMNTLNIPYAHLLSLLLPRSLNLTYGNEVLVTKGILVGVIHGRNQTVLLNAITNYGHEFFLKFMWDVQRMVHEYNMFHVITFSIADCIPSNELRESLDPVLATVPTESYSQPVNNIDLVIMNQGESPKRSNIERILVNVQFSLENLTKSFSNNLTNIVESGSKGNKDNIVQILMSVGIQAALSNHFIKSSYCNGLTAKELFIHSKSGRAGVISTSLNTSTTGYLQRELVKCMEDLTVDENGVVHDYANREVYFYPFTTNSLDISDNFLEYAFAESST